LRKLGRIARAGLRISLLLFVLWAAVPAPALAQSLDETTVQYDDWERVASRAEQVLEDRRASDIAFGELRDDVVDWRSQFLAAQSENATRLTTVRAQLQALGPAPAEGSEEVADIAERRADLVAQITRLDAPRIKAEEAFSRADGIIREIDLIVRERQADSLLALGPSPLNPTIWPEAYRELTHTLNAVVSELSTASRSSTQRAELRENLPLLLIYGIIATVLLARGRRWMERLTLRVQSSEAQSVDGVKGFLLSLGQVILPVIGLVALTEALFATKMIGFRGQLFVDAVPYIGAGGFLARWLALRLFPKYDRRQSLLDLAETQRAELRFFATLLGVLMGVAALFSRVADFEGYAESTQAVISLPLLILTGLCLFRTGRILADSPAAHATHDSSAESFDLRGRVALLVGRAAVLVGIAGPVIGAVGYTSGAAFFLYPSVGSLALIGVLLVLHGVIRDIYGFVTGKSEENAREALWPVLISFFVMLLSTPLFALIWGARQSDLTELWANFSEGISLGDVQISPSDFLTFAIIFLLGFGLTRLLQGALRTTILPKTKMDIGARTAIVSGIGYVGIFLAAVIAIAAAGIDLSSLAIVAGALSVGIGFGLQNIVSNFVSGIILLIERPISEGDWIEVGGQMGYVRDISVRSTRIETFDRTDVIVPNADLVSGTVTNYTRGNLIGRAIVPVGVAYGTDTYKVTEILKEIAENHPLVALNPPPAVHFIGFGADSMDFEIRAILRDVNFTLSVKTEMNHQIAQRFAEEGVEIPFAQRDVWLRNPEVLTPKPQAKPRPKPKGAT